MGVKSPIPFNMQFDLDPEIIPYSHLKVEYTFDSHNTVDDKYGMREIKHKNFNEKKGRLSKTTTLDFRSTKLCSSIIDKSPKAEDLTDSGYFLEPTMFLKKKSSIRRKGTRRFSSHSIDEKDLKSMDIDEIVIEEVDQEPATPNLTKSLYFDDEISVRPLYKEKLRDKLMPNEIKINHFDDSKTEYKGGSTFGIDLGVKPQSTTNKTSHKFEFDRDTKVESTKDKRIMQLEMMVSALKKENMDLRLSMNYFMQLGVSQK